MQGRGVAALVIALCLAGCASPALRPGIGDLSFRLTWSGLADLDLYVISPLGERLSFIRRNAPSGGVLDIDCNVRPDPTMSPGDDASWVCPRPMENIFWPTGGAPRGIYKYWAVLAYPEDMEPTDEYRLEVRRGRQVVRSHRGRISDLREGQVSHEIALEEG